MSKFIKVFVALLAVSALATPAFAITADFSGFYQARALMYDNLDGNDNVNDASRGIDHRYRLFASTALNEDVKAVFGIEVDQAWGSGTAGWADLGTDEKSVIELKHTYLDFNIPAFETNVKAGAQYYKLGRGILIGDDAAGILGQGY